MQRHAIVYRRPVCRCGSKMVTHVTLDDGSRRYGCSVCKTEIDKREVDKVEAEEWNLVGREGVPEVVREMGRKFTNEIQS